MAFFCYYKNTDGDFYKSALFTFYFINVKVNLVKLNNYSELNQQYKPSLESITTKMKTVSFTTDVYELNNFYFFNSYLNKTEYPINKHYFYNQPVQKIRGGNEQLNRAFYFFAFI